MVFAISRMENEHIGEHKPQVSPQMLDLGQFLNAGNYTIPIKHSLFESKNLFHCQSLNSIFNFKKLILNYFFSVVHGIQNVSNILD